MKKEAVENLKEMASIVFDFEAEIKSLNINFVVESFNFVDFQAFADDWNENIYAEVWRKALDSQDKIVQNVI